MSTMVWIALVFLTIMTIPILYYVFLAARSFIRASTEAGKSTEDETRRKLIQFGSATRSRDTEGKASVGERRSREAVASSRSGGRAAQGRSARADGDLSAREQADVEKVLAELESKRSGSGRARMRRRSNTTSEGDDVQRRPSGVSGNSGDSSSGGGA